MNVFNDGIGRELWYLLKVLKVVVSCDLELIYFIVRERRVGDIGMFFIKCCLLINVLFKVMFVVELSVCNLFRFFNIFFFIKVESKVNFLGEIFWKIEFSI